MKQEPTRRRPLTTPQHLQTIADIFVLVFKFKGTGPPFGWRDDHGHGKSDGRHGPNMEFVTGTTGMPV